MPFLIPTAGLLQALDDFRVGSITPGSIRLFTNSKVPAAGDVPGDYVEPVWVGYAPASGISWSAAALAGDIAFTDSPTLSFPVLGPPGGAFVQGYFCLNSAQTKVLFAESLASPIAPVEGVPVLLQVRFRHKNP